MDHMKVLVASEEKAVREPLMKYFSEWGMEALEFTKPPKISTLKSLSPQLVFMEKNFYSNYDFISESAEHQFESNNKPGIVIVVKPTDNMPLMQDVGQNSVLEIPYTPSSLFNTVKQALSSSSMECSLGAVLTKLDVIYSMLAEELSHSFQDMSESLAFRPDEMFCLEKKLLLDNKSGIIPKSKTLITSLLKDVKNTNELGQCEEKLKLLNQYITELEYEHLSRIEDPDLDPNLSPDLLKTHSLSRKEVKIFAMINKGMTTDQIAEKLFISSETVKSHRRNIRKKLSLVGNKASLSNFIHRLGDNDDNVAIDNSVCNDAKNA